MHENSYSSQKTLIYKYAYCEECQKGMWFKANQKGYRCGGNVKHGDSFCINKSPVREKELKHIILEDLQSLFNTLKEENFMNTLLNKLNVKKRQIIKDFKDVEAEIETQKYKKLDYVNLYTDKLISKEELVEFKELPIKN
jgi:site-specific DNA recombinase